MRLTAALAATTFAVSGCCGDSVNYVAISPSEQLGWTSAAYMVVGDTSTVQATAWGGSGLVCPARTIYGSDTEPARFQFRSSDSTVATFSATGQLRASTPGATQISITSSGHTSAVSLGVTSRAVAFRLRVTPTEVHPGDTVTVEAQAYGPEGVPVSGVHTRIDIGPRTRLGSWLSPNPAYPGAALTTRLTPFTITARIDSVAMPLLIRASTIAVPGRLSAFGDTVSIVVTPRP